MTDLEITKLCAEASGLIPHVPQIPFVCHTGDNLNGQPVSVMYDPLHDDAQAMALVKSFGITIKTTDGNQWYVEPMCIDGQVYVSCIDGASDLNRAICECVAKIQEKK